MFSYRLLHFQKKKIVLFLIGFFKPFFLLHFLAFLFKTFVLIIFFLFFIFSFDLVSSLPSLPQLLAFLSLYLSVSCCYLYVTTVNVTYRSPFACHLLVFFRLPAWSPVRIALPACTCACVAISYCLDCTWVSIPPPSHLNPKYTERKTTEMWNKWDVKSQLQFLSYFQT